MSNTTSLGDKAICNQLSATQLGSASKPVDTAYITNLIPPPGGGGVGSLQDVCDVGSVTTTSIACNDLSTNLNIVCVNGVISTTIGNIQADNGDINAPIGNITSGNVITAGSGIVCATGDIDASTGDVNATTGDVNAGNDVKAQNDIISTAGDIKATAGDVVATAGKVTAAGDIQNSAGDIKCDTGEIVAAQGNLRAVTGDVKADTGDLIASQGNLIASLGDVNATSGDVNCLNSKATRDTAGTTLTITNVDKATPVTTISTPANPNASPATHVFDMTKKSRGSYWLFTGGATSFELIVETNIARVAESCGIWVDFCTCAPLTSSPPFVTSHVITPGNTSTEFIVQINCNINPTAALPIRCNILLMRDA